MPEPPFDATLDLARWHADPLGPEAARALRARAQAPLTHAGAPAERFRRRLTTLIAGHWLGFDTERDCVVLRAGLDGPTERALLELVWGQLLMAGRRTGADAQLRHGFALAANLFRAEDYFRVRRRHELLALLPLTPQGTPPRTLASLLDEARIIELLRHAGGRPRRTRPDPSDTVG